MSSPSSRERPRPPAGPPLSWVWASPPDEGLRALGRALAEGCLPEPCTVLKHNANRTVWRIPWPGLPGLIVKRFQARSGERLKTRLLGGRAEREFQAMMEFCRAGLPSARPVGFAEVWRDGALEESWLLSREVAGARTLDEALTALPPDGVAARDLAGRALELIARLHEHPVWHRDLHAGNLLVDEREELVIIDLHSLWRVPWLTRRQRLENLGRFLFSLRSSVRLDRIDDLVQRYALARGDEPGRWRDPVARALEAFERDYVRGRSARCMRDSSEFVGERVAAGRIHRRREYDPMWLAADLAQHEQLERSGQGLLALSAATAVSMTTGPGEPRVVKHYRAAGLGPAWRARLGWGRARGAWRFARRCRVMAVPTPQALALLECRDGSAWLITRALPDAVHLTDWAEALPAGALGVPCRHDVARALGHGVGRLSRAGLRHADLSAKNVLVDTGEPEPVRDLRSRPMPGWPRMEFVDLDNMRRTSPHEPAALARMLGQLADIPRLTRTDVRRFLQGFEAAAGRSVPPQVQSVARSRLRARVARRARLEAARRAE